MSQILWLFLQLNNTEEVEYVWHWSDQVLGVFTDADDKLLIYHLNLVQKQNPETDYPFKNIYIIYMRLYEVYMRLHFYEVTLTLKQYTIIIIFKILFYLNQMPSWQIWVAFASMNSRTPELKYFSSF